MTLIVAVACTLPASPENQAAPPPTTVPLPTATFTATSTPLPTAIPTPNPAARVELGDQALFYGDWESAFVEFQRAFESNLDDEVRYVARLGIARTHFLAGELDEAQVILEEMESDESFEPMLAEVSFHLGQTY